jgi:hypothetical protein
MAEWARLNLHLRTQGAEITRAVDLFDTRREHDVSAGCLAHCDIGIEGARVSIEILAGPELGGVHEIGDDDAALRTHATASSTHQFSVTLVQCTHRHDDGSQ